MSSTRTESLFRIRPCNKRKISSNEVLLHLQENNATLSVPSLLADCFFACTEFRPLIVHARLFWEKTKGLDRVRLISDAFRFSEKSGYPISFSKDFLIEIIHQALFVFREKGFLIERRDFLGFDQVDENIGIDKKITTLVVSTCNRPALLKRGLTSYMENAKRFNRDVEFAVFDDSENRDAVEILREIKRIHNVPVLYAGKKERRDFVRMLRSEKFPKDVLDFCLFGLDGAKPTTGANRNAYLLHTLGEKVFITDDDTVCQIFKSPWQTEGIKVGPASEMIRCYPSFEAALKEVQPVDLDLLGLHEAALAPDVRTYLRRKVNETPQVHFSTSNMTGDMMRRIMSRECKPLISLNGMIGDSGAMIPPDRYLASDELKKIFQSESDFVARAESRQQIKLISQETIQRKSSMMAMFFGLNNQEILFPPFIPLFRSSDDLFGKLIHVLIPQACFSCLPWLVAHKPENRKGYELQGEIIHKVWPVDVLMFAVDEMSFEDGNNSPEGKMREMGGAFKKMGALAPDHFHAHLKKIKSQMVLDEIEFLEKRLGTTVDYPAYYKKYLSGQLAGFRQSLENSHDVVPRPIVEHWGTSGSLDQYRRLISLYGDLLVWWPEIVRKGIQMKLNNIRMACPV